MFAPTASPCCLLSCSSAAAASHRLPPQHKRTHTNHPPKTTHRNTNHPPKQHNTPQTHTTTTAINNTLKQHNTKTAYGMKRPVYVQSTWLRSRGAKAPMRFGWVIDLLEELTLCK